MTKPNDQAFPITAYRDPDRSIDEDLSHESCGGLTKREEFARSAMQGLLSSDEGYGIAAEKIAHYAVAQADALIAELSKEQKRTEGRG